MVKGSEVGTPWSESALLRLFLMIFYLMHAEGTHRLWLQRLLYVLSIAVTTPLYIIARLGALIVAHPAILGQPK